MTFGERLKDLRIKRGFKQYDLSDKLEMTRESISAYENGHAQPSIEVLIKLCDIFHVSADYLLGRDITVTSGQVNDIKPILDEMLELTDFIPRYVKMVNKLQTIVNK
jgi:transcriptional regulator with XRE-family HTH domain